METSWSTVQHCSEQTWSPEPVNYLNSPVHSLINSFSTLLDNTAGGYESGFWPRTAWIGIPAMLSDPRQVSSLLSFSVASTVTRRKQELPCRAAVQGKWDDGCKCCFSVNVWYTRSLDGYLLSRRRAAWTEPTDGERSVSNSAGASPVGCAVQCGRQIVRK